MRWRGMGRGGPAVLTVALGCMAASSASIAAEKIAPPSPTPLFAPDQFFLGRTEGAGVLKVMMSKPEQLRVRSHGRLDGDTLVLDQVVERPSEKPDQRQWRFKKLGPGRYSGSLSIAEGPVAMALSGNRLHLKYRLKKEKVNVEQFIYLQPDGRAATNRMTLHRLGLKVGTLEEVIRKLD